MAIADTVKRGRQLSAKYMPLAVLVREKTEGSYDPDGYWVPGGWRTVATTKGRLAEMSGEERVIAQGLQESVEGVLVIPFGVAVQNTQSLLVDGVPYSIRHVKVGTPQYQADTRLMVARGGTS